MTVRLALLVLALLVAPAFATAQNPPLASNVPSIITNGEAVVRRAPDQAFITAAVESRARNPRDAQRQNAEAMTAVQQKIIGAGIPRDAVRTLGYTIQQEFDFVNGRRVPRDYLARNALEVRVDAIDRVGEMLDLAVQAGATSVHDTRFEIRDRAGAEREALRLAVVDARSRADAAAAGAGRQVDQILRIEDALREMPPMPRPVAMARMTVQDAPVETPVEPGTIEIRARVTLTVSIK
jgi:uncharacterized protein YggE